MPGWDTFAVVIGGTGGALVGLLFVAISIHAAKLGSSADLRNRAAQTLVVFATLLLASVILAVLSQPDRLVGVEFVVLAVVVAVGPTLVIECALTVTFCTNSRPGCTFDEPPLKRRHPANQQARGVPIRYCYFSRSNRSLFITLTHAATKSSTNFRLLSSCA